MRRRLGASWIGILSALSLMVAPVHGFQWRWGDGGQRQPKPASQPYLSPLFPRNKPWGQNEYLLIGASVVVTIVAIVLITSDHHHDDGPHPY